MRREEGFSLVEMMVAMGLMLVVVASVFAMMNPSQGSAQAQPEVADMQQRSRVSADALYKDLVMAGDGSYSGKNVAALTNFFAPVMPYRTGLIGEDPPGTFKTDTITIMYVPPTNAQTTINRPMPMPSAEIVVSRDPGCPMDGTADENSQCHFADGMNALIYDDTGAFDVFTITHVQPNAEEGGHLQHRDEDLSKPYDTGARIVQVAHHTYYLQSDDAAGTYRLMHYDGTGNPDVPVVDDVVGLSFDYYADPQPPTMRKSLLDTSGPYTTYGPKPSLTAVNGFLPKENCVFVDNGSNTPSPRLPVLGAGGTTRTLVKLTAAQLADGPWCPNDANVHRYDADLLRIRKVVVTIRVQAALTALRGPAGPLFTHGGTSTSANRYVPDQLVTFEVTPRNLNLGR